MELKHLNEQEFNTVKNGTKPAMIDFFATWCGPCKMLGPVMEQLADRYDGKAVVAKVDVDEQQMLAMGRALMSKPKIILMDEPSMGLSPIFVNEIFDIIQAVSESGTTVLLVEQNAKKALSIADRAYVLETGKITMSGNAKDLLEDEAVKKAYLGE